MPHGSPPGTVPAQQYYISRRTPDDVPKGFRHLTCASWHLVVDADFKVLPIVDDGDRVGFVFGTVLDVGGVVEDGELRLGRSSGEVRSVAFERAFRHLLGRFVALLDTGEGVRVYTDPIGALPAVYDESERLVAASPMAMPGVDREARFRADLFDAVRWPLVSRGSNVWLPGGLTYYQGIARLLPNHYLDLDTWGTGRFWPTEADIESTDNAAAEIRTVGSMLSDIMDQIVATYDRSALTLTAGKDSRSLLATARGPVTDRRMSLFTIGDSDRDVDVHVARRIARAHGLDWTALPIIEATAEEQSEWFDRTGYAVGSAIVETYPTMRSLDADVELGGLGGEIGRAYLWKPSDEADTEIGPTDVLFRYQKPDHPELVAALEDWFRTVEQFDTYTTLDLAHQEHRLGGWAGPQHLGFRPDVDHIRPFCYRPVIESVHRLPPDVRRTDQLPHRVIGNHWVELDRVPYNAFTDWKKFWAPIVNGVNTARAAASNPDRTIDYISHKYIRQ